MKLLSCILSLFFTMCLMAYGQDIRLEINGETITVVEKMPFAIHAEKGSDLYFWSYPSTVKAMDKGDILEILNAPKGELTISVKTISIDWERKQLINNFGSIKFMVGIQPRPDPDIKPDPDDEDTKPDPDEKHIINRKGLHVLMVYESEDVEKLPSSQQAVLFSKTIRDYLNQKSVVDPTNSNWKAWRIYDKDVDLTNENQLWKTMLENKGSKLPSIVISNYPNGSHVGPLPMTVNETMELLKKFGE